MSALYTSILESFSLARLCGRCPPPRPRPRALCPVLEPFLEEPPLLLLLLC